MRMNRYPSYMVPYNGLNPEVKVEDLLDYCDFSIARRVDKPFSEEDLQRMGDGTYIVRSDSSLREETFERVPNLSTTMLRRVFPIKVAKYDLTMKPTDDWKGGMVNPLRFRGKARLNQNSYLMVYRASHLHGEPVRYQRRFESLKDAKTVQEYYEDLKDSIITNQFRSSTLFKSFGHIFLKHSPTALNYWHYELKLRKSEGGYIENTNYKPGKDEQKMNMKQSFVSYVLDNYLFKMLWIDENPCGSEIPMSYFYDSRVCEIKRFFASLINKCLYTVVPIVA